MPDRAFFPLVALVAILLIALAFVWPQGLGKRSPKPFGFETASQVAARTPKLRPSTNLPSALPAPVLSPALAPEPSSVPPPMTGMPPSPAPVTAPTPAAPSTKAAPAPPPSPASAAKS